MALPAEIAKTQMITHLEATQELLTQYVEERGDDYSSGSWILEAETLSKTLTRIITNGMNADARENERRARRSKANELSRRSKANELSRRFRARRHTYSNYFVSDPRTDLELAQAAELYESKAKKEPRKGRSAAEIFAGRKDINSQVIREVAMEAAHYKFHNLINAQNLTTEDKERDAELEHDF